MSQSNVKFRVGQVCLTLALTCISATAFAQADGRVLPVPRVVIYSGDTIADGSLLEKSFRDSELSRSNPVSIRSELVGHIARRTLLPGQPIEASAIRVANSIKQGRPTTAIFEVGGLSITGTVVPLQSAAAGDWISFQNSESGVVLRGIAQEDGTIRIGSP